MRGTPEDNAHTTIEVDQVWTAQPSRALGISACPLYEGGRDGGREREREKGGEWEQRGKERERESARARERTFPSLKGFHTTQSRFWDTFGSELFPVNVCTAFLEFLLDNYCGSTDHLSCSLSSRSSAPASVAPISYCVIFCLCLWQTMHLDHEFCHTKNASHPLLLEEAFCLSTITTHALRPLQTTTSTQTEILQPRQRRAA